MTTVRPRPELAVLRESQDRQLEREGIPMYLALVDEAGGAPAPATASAVRADGARLAERLEHVRHTLAAAQRDGDLGITASVLQAVAHADFDRSGPGTLDGS